MCFIILLEMKKLVKNKVCGYIYEEEVIVGIIEFRYKQKKKVCCFKIGCSYMNVRKLDFIQDEVFRRVIENYNKRMYYFEQEKLFVCRDISSLFFILVVC